jgi:hypothetical protein
MKIFKIALALTVLVSATTFTSCNKYEEGPAISLRSAESRVDNTWEVEKFIDSDGTETAGDSNDPVYTMTKDGELSVVIGSQNATGNWTLNSDETTLRLEYTYSFINFDFTYTILRLTNDELWLEDEDGDKTYLKEK